MKLSRWVCGRDEKKKYNLELTGSFPSSLLHSFSLMRMATVVYLTILLQCMYNLTMVRGMAASPLPFRERQPSGTMTPDLFIRGNPKFQYLTDSNGYSVMPNHNRTMVYAVVDESLGYLVPTEMIVGVTNPTEMEQLVPHIMPNLTVRETMCGRLCQDKDSSQSAVSAMMMHHAKMSMNPGAAVRKNLVILARFADHKDRALPSQLDYDALFNSATPGSSFAPSGSVRSFFEVNSYGSLDLQSIVVGWITLPKSEAYYSDGQSGLNNVFVEAVHDALGALDDGSFQWSDTDENGDGVVDTLTLIHSGYAAEWGQMDANGQSLYNRIWSHQWELPRSNRWTSSSGVQVRRYMVCPGLWSTHGFEIGRIGVIVHETGHYLGLPDLYGSGTQNDVGIGAYDTMSNSWGFDNSQRFPPHLSPWSKGRLGWSHPILVSQTQQVNITASAVTDQVYRVDLGPSEYLLIENRQRHAFDQMMPSEGLAIWHIDEEADLRVPGYPGQAGWPENGQHYRVALLQADGQYDLERGNNFGDSADFFHEGGVSSLGFSKSGDIYPNTNTYQEGNIMQSGIVIHAISASSLCMNFTVSFPSQAILSQTPSFSPTRTSSDAPSQSPTTSPYKLAKQSTQELVAPLVGGNGAAGNMFDIFVEGELLLIEMAIHTYAETMISVEIWSKKGSYQGHEVERSDWNLLSAESIQAQGRGKQSFVPLPRLHMHASETRAFYITVTSGEKLAYTNGKQLENAFAFNADVQILEGVGKSYPFGATYSNRRWNGVIRYEVLESTSTSTPSTDPTEPPSEHPSYTPKTNSAGQSLSTTFVGGTSQAGNMFDVLPYKTLLVTGFDLHVDFTGNVTVEVYTKFESFRGYESACAEWTLAATVSLVGQGRGVATSTPPDTFSPIVLEGLRVSSFYITVVSETPGGLRYTRGDGSLAPVARDENLLIFEGVGKSYPCRKTYSDRIWNGAIQYLVLEELSDITTTFIGGRQAAGIMFDVDFNNALRIIAMELHVASEAVVSLEIFTKSGSFLGFENDQAAWSMITNTTLTGQGKGRRTPVPMNAFAPMLVEAKSKVAFYITFTDNEMRYSSGQSFDVAGSNEDMVVGKGIGRDYLFGTSFADRVWNGVFKYALV